MIAANYTRRLDLFKDSGFDQPEIYVDFMVNLSKELGLNNFDLNDNASKDKISKWADENLSWMLKPLTQSSVPYLIERKGDLATLFWMAKQLHNEIKANEMAAYILRICLNFQDASYKDEALALLKFLVNVDFEYGDLYKELGVSHGFFRVREPNPFVWKILSVVKNRIESGALSADHMLEILELGCGNGNDAQGFFTSKLFSSYTGVDISDVALTEHNERSQDYLSKNPDKGYELCNEDFIGKLDQLSKNKKREYNLIYSYSSLHYFNSEEVELIFSLAKKILEPGKGLFCFAIKGKGSIWDGEGVSLYRPDVWINYDGQSRWFPSKSKLAAMLDSYGYEIIDHSIFEHWSYSKLGEPDNFHYCICSPRA